MRLQAASLTESLLLLLALSNAPRALCLPTVDLGYSVNQATFNATGDYYTFSNIRFAEPPMGDLRFEAPVPPRTTNRTVNDGSAGFICPQAYPAWILAAEGLSAAPPPSPSENEDCLFLDVAVPQAIFNGTQKGAAVLAWVYGGGYTLGTKAGSPAGLIARSEQATGQGIIYVAMNYRLGLFGWLSGSTYQSQNGTANAGLYDQRLAFDWVQKYIHLFGGDPNRVTVIGESAGAGSIEHQITAYGGSKGKVPFQQAILQSPGFAPIPNNDQEERLFHEVLNSSGVSTLQKLKGLSTTQLQAVNRNITEGSDYGSFTFGPTVDGVFSPALPGILLSQGKFDQSLNLLIGHNSNEGALFTAPVQTDATFAQNVRNLFPDISPTVFTIITEVLYPPDYSGAYGYTTEFGRSSTFWAEVVFVCNTNYLARAYKNKSYNYVFSVPPGVHGEDVPYTFYDGPSPSVVNDTVAVVLQDWITTFAVAGVPSAEGLPSFPQYGLFGTAEDLNVTGVAPFHDPGSNLRCYWLQNAYYA
ncbi:alpha/beta-hydrolase [Mytilinidion resinicola]|uniref:Carboxylic ester hydrolase n=1 Tax=Mytilinidion resinicola TaxID=574789 RepID=A0A6A6Y885_9PEZI|nr:alpha/beta-hydrolase [Mytilinidion resinicola]KAF2804763.1 alpha/beta-hydrolase [Mytilinidion resinicola]